MMNDGESYAYIFNLLENVNLHIIASTLNINIKCFRCAKILQLD